MGTSLMQSHLENTNKVKVGIIGTGNIGTDIMKKLERSDVLECGMFVGRNPDSKGIAIAREMGVRTSTDSIQAIVNDPNCCDIVFDATSANVHRRNAPVLKGLGKYVLDLTPARVGRMCVPVLNMEECLETDNVNLITCGGQATAPLAHAISEVHPDVKYLEVVATISSRSAGKGTRDNIDEFTQTTKEALMEFSGIRKTKAIIILNPAEPPVIMHNTVYAMIDNPDMDAITKAVLEMESRVRKYVPGYRIIMPPTLENGRVTTTLQVLGLGDYLPEYAGNLDIITCAAIEIAENYAKRKLLKEAE